jgi:hypothetical protein
MASLYGKGTLPSPVVLVSFVKHGPPVTVHLLCRSTSSTMTLFLTSFISIDRPSLMETRVMNSVSKEGGIGIANNGGTNPHKFAKGGET